MLLEDKTYLIDRDDPDQRFVNWYSALRYLKNFKSVVYAEWTNMCSSAGDWEGFIVQHIGNTNYLIPISQENNYPRIGYTLYTGKVVESWSGEFDQYYAESIFAEYYEEIAQ
jgi:hypothetical protein